VEVNCVEKGCTGSKGRALVAVSDLIEVSFLKNNGKYSLVLNADILLHPKTGEYLASQKRGLTMIPRWEIDAISSIGKAEFDPWGYDGMWLGAELRGIFRNRTFGLGLPWWDYWIPFRALHQKHLIRIPKNPLAHHVRHPEQWSEQDRARLAGEIWREVDVSPWKRFYLRHFGPKAERKNYGYHNHLAGHIRKKISEYSE